MATDGRAADTSTPWGRGQRLLELHTRLMAHLEGLDAVRRERRGRRRDPFHFPDMVDVAGRTDRAVHEAEKVLKTGNRIRNMLVHDACAERGCPVVAPCEHFLELFERAVGDIVSPPAVPTSSPPHVFRPEDPLADALAHMAAGDYSQVVVRRRNGSHRLLTVEGVAKWLESSREVGLADLEGATVGDAVAHDVNDAWEIAPGSLSVFEAEDRFAVPGRRLYALIVTKNGKPEEPPLGLVTPWDLLHRGSSEGGPE